MRVTSRVHLMSSMYTSSYFFSFFLSYQNKGLITFFDVRYQFIPQMIFLNSLFGYLSLLIIVKWCSGSQADLYHVMIYMFLSPFDDLRDNQLFWGQSFVQAWSLWLWFWPRYHETIQFEFSIWLEPCFLQVILLLCAVVAVPWMLFPKPFILKRQHSEVVYLCFNRLFGKSKQS